MTKREYLDQLESELTKRNVTDMLEIISEYDQHFAFKMADGFSQEEIAAKLGSPKTLAAQFESGEAPGPGTWSKVPLRIGLGFVALFEEIFFLLLFVFAVGLAAAAIACVAAGVCMAAQIACGGLIPYAPYPGTVILGASLLSFAVLLAAAAYYCLALVRQMGKASVRWHKNMVSNSPLPPLPAYPQFSGKTRRTLRALLLGSIAVFGASFVLGFVVLALQAGTVGFWHAWHWFVK